MTRFLVDAHLPMRIVRLLDDAGHDTVHTSILADGNATADSEINRISITEQRVVMTKDADFVQSFTLSGRPYKLLLVSTGNISNRDLHRLLAAQLDALADLLADYRFVELTRDALIAHS